jgi:X-X-X-Leu-X-X-Gly heptad repeat protein
MKYEYENDREAGAASKISYLLGGIGIGAILALLFAPKSGQELRGDIADVTRKGVEKGKETAALVGEKAGDYYEVSREKATEFYQTAQDKAGELAEKAGELKNKAGELVDKAGGLTEKAKDAVSATKNPFSAAIEAGKEAYQDEKRRTEPNVIAEGRPSYPIKDNKDRILEIPDETKTEE